MRFSRITKIQSYKETDSIVRRRREAKRVQLSWVSWARCQEPPQFHFKELQSKNPWPTLLGNDFAWFCNYGQAKPTLMQSQIWAGRWRLNCTLEKKTWKQLKNWFFVNREVVNVTANSEQVSYGQAKMMLWCSRKSAGRWQLNRTLEK